MIAGLLAAGLLAFPFVSVNITPTSDTTWLLVPESEWQAGIAAACGPAGEDRGTLLRQHDRVQFTITGSSSVQLSDALDLACLRTGLLQLDAPAREGWQQYLGDSWQLGAIRALARGLEADDATSSTAEVHRAGELLGVLLLGDPRVPDWDEVGRGLLVAIRFGGDDVRYAARACARTSLLSGLRDQSRECSQIALVRGQDSVWQSLHLSRMAAAEGNTAEATRLLGMALGSATASGDWQNVEWHLSWFLRPEELLEWQGVPSQDRGQWVLTLLAGRDLRDGLEPGGRWLAHLQRLDHVDSMFRMLLPRSALARFRYAATPVSEIDPWKLVNYWEPGLVPASPFREYQRTHPDYDDRAHVWMRFGAPDRQVPWSIIDTVTPRPEDRMRVRSTNIREVWRYRVPGGVLIVSFEAENFDASNQATRLVAGVLGSYFCDVDAYRCNLSTRATMGLVGQDRIGTLTRADREIIQQAVERDYSGREQSLPAALSADAFRIRDPRSQRGMLLVTWAIRASDLARGRSEDHDTAAVRLEIRRWHGQDHAFRSDTVVRRLRLPQRLPADAHVTGHEAIVDQGSIGWAVSLLGRGDVRGRVAGLKRAVHQPGVWLSDIVIGAHEQNESLVLSTGEQVVLAPLGVVDRTRPVQVYWQTSSDTTMESTSTRIVISSIEDSSTVLDIRFESELVAGFAQEFRELDVSRAPRGEHRLRLELLDDSGNLLASQETALRVD